MAASACRQYSDLLTFHPDDTLELRGEFGKGPIDDSEMRQMKNRLDRAIELFYGVDSESVGSVNRLVRVGTLAQRQINALAKKAFKAPVAPEPKRTGEIE